ncbi:MAG: hypothetical protein Q4A92_07615 [Corynebacterium sp.]|nr:hypothetical protein [Corynebacterium sp.]
MKNLGRFVPLVGALGGLVLLAVGGTALAGGTAEPKIDPKPVTFKAITTTSTSETPTTTETTPVEPPQEPTPEPAPQQPAPVYDPPAPPPAAPPPAPPPQLPPLPPLEIHIPPFVPPVALDMDDDDDEDDD